MTRIAAAALAGLLASACGHYASAPSNTVTGLQIRCDATTLNEGQTASCSASATYADRTVSDQTAAADWTSSDGSVARVAKGVVTAVTAGTADISAKFQNVSAKTTVTVRVGIR